MKKQGKEVATSLQQLITASSRHGDGPPGHLPRASRQMADQVEFVANPPFWNSL